MLRVHQALQVTRQQEQDAVQRMREETQSMTWDENNAYRYHMAQAVRQHNELMSSLSTKQQQLDAEAQRSKDIEQQLQNCVQHFSAMQQDTSEQLNAFEQQRTMMT